MQANLEDFGLTARAVSELLGTVLGEKLGAGVSREVFTSPIDPSVVFKVEAYSQVDKGWGFQNVEEYLTWKDLEGHEEYARWLAPCKAISSSGIILVQHRVSPIPKDFPLPDEMPDFLTDFKRANYGLLDGRLVCLDYGLNRFRQAGSRSKKVKMRKVLWRDS